MSYLKCCPRFAATLENTPLAHSFTPLCAQQTPVDLCFESETVITSAMKLLSNSVYDGVKAFYDGSFPGGKTSVFTVENEGVGLPMETSKFETFTQADYDAIYAKLVAGEFELVQPSADNIDPTADLTVSATTIKYVE